VVLFGARQGVLRFVGGKRETARVRVSGVGAVESVRSMTRTL